VTSVYSGYWTCVLDSCSLSLSHVTSRKSKTSVRILWFSTQVEVALRYDAHSFQIFTPELPLADFEISFDSSSLLFSSHSFFHSRRVLPPPSPNHNFRACSDAAVPTRQTPLCAGILIVTVHDTNVLALFLGNIIAWCQRIAVFGDPERLGSTFFLTFYYAAREKMIMAVCRMLASITAKRVDDVYHPGPYRTSSVPQHWTG